MQLEQHSPNRRRQAFQATGRQGWDSRDELQELPALGFAQASENVHKVQERGRIAVVSIRGNQTRKKLFFRPWINLS